MLCVFSLSNATATSRAPKAYKKYKGLIGDKYPIKLDITTKGTDFQGSIFYDTCGSDIPIHGTISKSKEMNIFVEAADDKSEDYSNEVFRGKFTAINVVEGVWTNRNKKSSHDFKFSEITDGITPIYFDILHSGPNGPPVYIDLVRVKLPNKAVERLINQDIRCRLANIINSRKYKTISSIVANIQRVFDEIGGDSMEFECNVITNESNILSISINSIVFTGGMPPATYNTFLLNYDVSTGQQIDLEDLLIPDFEQRLDSINDAKKNYQNQGFKLNNNFAITNSGLLFQCIDHKMGHENPTKLIPYNKIEYIIKKDGILQRFLKSIGNKCN